MPGWKSPRQSVLSSAVACASKASQAKQDAVCRILPAATSWRENSPRRGAQRQSEATLRSNGGSNTPVHLSRGSTKMHRKCRMQHHLPIQIHKSSLYEARYDANIEQHSAESKKQAYRHGGRPRRFLRVEKRLVP